MLNRILVLVSLIATVATARGQSTIVYRSGPSFQIPGFFRSGVDLNGDGAPELQFEADSGCIGSPEGGVVSCETTYWLSSSLEAEFVRSGPLAFYAAALPFGIRIGEELPASAQWSGTRSFGGLVRGSWDLSHGLIMVNGQPVYSSWDGPLGNLGVGYLGVRFRAADGLHYGWVRVRLPGVVVDWAYESRPNTPIRAGDIGTSGDSIQFTVDFRNADGTPHGFGQFRSLGTAILTGNTLRFELDMVGWFSSAALRGPAATHSESKALYDFGQPLIAIHPPCSPLGCDPDFTVFFGEASLNPGQVVQLKRGALYVSLAEGAIVGRIKAAQ